MMMVMVSALRIKQDLKGHEFDSVVVDSKEVYLVEFYSGMCGSCKEFSPIWNEVAASLQGKIETEKINIDDKAGMEVAKKGIV